MKEASSCVRVGASNSSGASSALASVWRRFDSTSCSVTSLLSEDASPLGSLNRFIITSVASIGSGNCFRRTRAI